MYRLYIPLSMTFVFGRAEGDCGDRTDLVLWPPSNAVITPLRVPLPPARQAGPRPLVTTSHRPHPDRHTLCCPCTLVRSHLWPQPRSPHPKLIYHLRPQIKYPCNLWSNRYLAVSRGGLITPLDLTSEIPQLECSHLQLQGLVPL